MRLDSRASRAISVRPVALFAFLAASLSCGDSTGPNHGPPTAMEKIAGDATTGNAGAAVTPAPSVRVTDAEDRPVPGVDVTFEVVGGGGTLTNAVVETDEDGVATVGAWTLGILGSNAVRASATSVPAVTFTSTSVCGSLGPLTLGGQVSGTLATTDCRYPEGYYTDRYTFTLASPSTVMFTQTSAQFDSYLELLLDNEVVAANDDVASGNLNSGMRVILPAGTYQVGATSEPINETGSYVVSAQTASSLMTECDAVFVLPGITADQELDATDCPTGDEPDVFYNEQFLIFMEAGRSYTVTLSSATFETYLIIGRPTSQGLANAQTDDSSEGNNSRLVYTATVDDFYLIVASSGLFTTSGAYRITVQ